jgi:nucleotide-binding universal stress UspA family protein
MRILVAVDGSHCSMDAAREVSCRPWPPQSLIRILYVDEHGLERSSPRALPSGAHGPGPSLRDCAGHAVEKAVAQFDATSRSDVSVQGAIRAGNASDAILAEADAWDADLIVVGSHGKGSLERALLGSVSTAVAARARCSVEIVRPRRKASSQSRATDAGYSAHLWNG